MIYILESQPRKVPGLTSLFIKFDYKKEIVDIIKQCDTFVYHTKEVMWEVPTTNLFYLIRFFSQYDKIKLKLSKDNQGNKIPDFELPEFKTTPFKYQEEGIKFCLEKEKSLLLDAPGLGKTLQAIYIAETLAEQKKIKNCLIISCKNMLKYNWINEIKKHSKYSGTILGEKISKNGKSSIGTVKERIAAIPNIEDFFTVTNIETIRDKDIIKPLNQKYDMVIVDEIHCCKDPQSQQGANLLKLTMNYKVGMTGTMLLNSPFDCFVPLKFIEYETCNFSTFKNYYGKFSNYILLGYRNTDVIKEQLQNCSLRRTKDLLELPSKNIINEYIEMAPDHYKLYNNIKEGIVEDIDKVEINTVSLLAMLVRLRQATASPSSLTTENIFSTKEERCVELVEEIVGNGDSVVVFTTFKDTANSVYQRLKQYNPILVTGDTNDPEADVKFQNDPNIKVLVGTWQKAGTGLTLTKANYMIFIDTPWTYAVYEQAQDRIYRIGTNKKVFIYNLICKDTVDEKVLKIVNGKRAMSDYVIDDTLPRDDIEELKKYILDLKPHNLI